MGSARQARKPHLPLGRKRARPGSEFIQADISVGGVGAQCLEKGNLPETKVPPCKVVPLVEPHALEARHRPGHGHGHLWRSRQLGGQSQRMRSRPTRRSRTIRTSNSDGRVKQPRMTSPKTGLYALPVQAVADPNKIPCPGETGQGAVVTVIALLPAGLKGKASPQIQTGGNRCLCPLPRPWPTVRRGRGPTDGRQRRRRPLRWHSAPRQG